VGIYGNEGITPTTAIGTVVLDSPYAVAVQGQVFEAVDPQAWVPVIGDAVLVDYLPVSSQWVIVAII
jgi:hypothetical protein